jgi:pyruvate-formate lyase
MGLDDIAPTCMEIASVLRLQALADPSRAALPAPEREAGAFGYVLEHAPIGLMPHEPLAGDCGWQFATPAEQQSVRAALASGAPAPEPSVLDALYRDFNCTARYTLAHTCVDYPAIIGRGVKGLLAEIEATFPRVPEDRQPMLRGMRAALRALVSFSRRFAALASDGAELATDPAERQCLREVAGICRKVPENPSETVREALQAAWLVHVAVGFSELSDASLSLGRLDQYLYPLYQGDLRRGVPEAEIENLLRCLWLKCNRFGDPACAVNLGGLDDGDRDLFNPLSELIVRVSAAMGLPAPVLAARVHEKLPPEACDLLLSPELLAMGQPTFYGERACRDAMVRRGVPLSEARQFAVSSCMGLVVPGAEISDMWGIEVNLLLPLELALNGGEPFLRPLPMRLRVVPSAGCTTFDSLYAQVESHLDALLDYLVPLQRQATARVGSERPNPFLSVLTRGCRESGMDRAEGGARHHSVIVEGFGWANLADSLTAIQRLAFEEGRYSLETLTAAVKADFAGHDDVRAAVEACPKYGNADPDADAMAARVSASFARSVSARSRGSLRYLPSYHTLNTHIRAGSKLAASLDGRRAGAPLGKNAGPMPGHRHGSVTALLLSASAIDQGALSGGQALDISLDPKLLRVEEDRRKVQALLLTYFGRGGLQIQVNGRSADELRAAIREPQAHRDLIVRIAGFSARFADLEPVIQEEMVARFEAGL